MPNAHFECTLCGRLQLRTYRVADVGGPSWPPTCGLMPLPEATYLALCRGTLIMAPQPGDFAIDAKEPFQRFTVHRQQPTKDGIVQIEETVDSLHKVRQIERDSEQRYANGEGEPLRFRAYSQNPSNKDVGGFGREGSIGGRRYDSGVTPQKRPNISTTRHGQQKPKVAVARGGGTTALRG